jgi:hypothetical protein
MIRTKTLRFISVLISLFLVTGLSAQEPEKPKRPQTMGVQYQDTKDSAQIALEKKPLPLLEGISVSADLLGAIMYEVAHYGQLEGAVRFNLKGVYFPTVELGLGHSDYTNDATDLHYKTNSPYIRIGCDYNFVKDKRSGNRILAGLRYGFSKIKYDLSGPDLVDPVWGTSSPYSFKSLDANCSWLDLVFGLEAKIWDNFHIGWSIRYRIRTSQKKSNIGQAWYVPGYGKNDDHCFGGTFNLIFDI